MKIFLVGYMTSGKSSFGKKLGYALNTKFIDLDEYIEKKLNHTIPYHFQTQGEESFREIEHESLKEIIHMEDDFVLATGGGTPCFYDNMDLLNKNGKTIYLKVDVNVLIDRLKNTSRKRPLMANIERDDIDAYVKKHFAEREKCYNKSSIIIDTLAISVSQLVQILSY
jgi:shikimate kinase